MGGTFDMPSALLITLLATLPSLCLQIAMNMTLDPLMRIIEQFRFAEMTVPALSRMFRALIQNLTPTARGLWLMIPVLFLLLPFLSLGRHWFTLRILRGMEGNWTDVFGRLGCFVKAIGLHVLLILLIVLWGMPGLMIMLLGAYIAISNGNLNAFTSLYSIGMVVSVVLMVRASLTYELSDIEMADEPEKSILTCLRNSRERMNGLKFMLLMLVVSFLGYILLTELLTSFLGQISYVVAMAVSIALSLVISAYMETAVCAFYEQVKFIRKNVEAEGQTMSSEGE